MLRRKVMEQTRAMDLSARPCEKLGELGVDGMDGALGMLGADDMNEVLSMLGLVFANSESSLSVSATRCLHGVGGFG